MIGSRIFLVPVEDGETVHILDYDVTFFDILSTKARQFGFTTVLKNGCRFTCAGDEPYNPDCRAYVEGSTWLLHEAFCLYKDREVFSPYEKPVSYTHLVPGAILRAVLGIVLGAVPGAVLRTVLAVVL